MKPKAILPRKRAKAKKPPPRKSTKLDRTTVAALDALAMRSYHESYLSAWFVRAVAVLNHLYAEADSLDREANRNPAGQIAGVGNGRFELYASSLKIARDALSEMIPPLPGGSPVLSNVVTDLRRVAELAPWRDADCEGGEG